MHLSEGVLPWPQAAAYAATITPCIYISFNRLKKFQSVANVRQRALFALGLAMIFAVTLIPIPIPLSPVMVHMCATPLVALCLGVVPMILPIALVLGLQALFFGHGGLTTIGANILTLAIIGPTLTAMTFQTLRTLRTPRTLNIFTSVLIGSMSIYLADAVILSYALSAEQSQWSWFQSLVAALSIGQIPLSLLEATLSVVIVQALARGRHDLLPPHLASYSAVSPQ